MAGEYLKSSVHVHSKLCDGKNTLDEIAVTAWRNGLQTLGFSGHSPLPFANDWAIDQSCLADYLREARSLQADFRGRFSLYCGLEWDSCSPLPEQKLDYLIGSVHYFPALPDGTRFTVDGSAQLLAQCAQVQFGGDMAAQADCYYALVACLAEVPQVDIVGHFDLITKFDEPHTRYPIVPPSARAAMERLIRAGKIFEINTGAISRGYRQTPYPADPLHRRRPPRLRRRLRLCRSRRACLPLRLRYLLASDRGGLRPRAAASRPHIKSTTTAPAARSLPGSLAAM